MASIVSCRLRYSSGSRYIPDLDVLLSSLSALGMSMNECSSLLLSLGLLDESSLSGIGFFFGELLVDDELSISVALVLVCWLLGTLLLFCAPSLATSLKSFMVGFDFLAIEILLGTVVVLLLRVIDVEDVSAALAGAVARSRMVRRRSEERGGWLVFVIVCGIRAALERVEEEACVDADVLKAGSEYFTASVRAT